MHLKLFIRSWELGMFHCLSLIYPNKVRAIRNSCLALYLNVGIHTMDRVAAMLMLLGLLVVSITLWTAVMVDATRDIISFSFASAVNSIHALGSLCVRPDFLLLSTLSPLYTLLVHGLRRARRPSCARKRESVLDYLCTLVLYCHVLCQ